MKLLLIIQIYSGAFYMATIFRILIPDGIKFFFLTTREVPK